MAVNTLLKNVKSSLPESLWSAVAERSGDTALGYGGAGGRNVQAWTAPIPRRSAPTQSGVAAALCQRSPNMLTSAPLRALCILAFIALFSVSVSAATFLVTIRNNTFTPKELTINIGDIVTWTNTQGMHDTICGSSGQPCGDWNSNVHFGRLMRFRDAFSFTFASPGAHPYYCGPHWEEFGMSGTVTVLPPPNVGPTVSITSPSNEQIFSAPANITIQANASDNDGNVAQVEFFMNGNSIGVSGQPYQATANNLAVSNYTFSAVATDNSGAKATNSVSISVTGQGPAITTPPQSQTVTNGSEVNFTFLASGTGPLRYQWSFNEALIEGATGTSLVLTNVSTNASGTYTIGVTNDFGGTAASANLTVTNVVVGTPPIILIHPQSQTVREGTNVTFSVTASGSLPVSYQWYQWININDPVIIPDATNSVLILTNGYNIAFYQVVVSNAFGITDSALASLCVDHSYQCQFSLSSSNALFDSLGGTRGIHVDGGGEFLSLGLFCPRSIGYYYWEFCFWDVINTNSWIEVQIADPTPDNPDNWDIPNSLTFTVSRNTNQTARTGVILIADIPFLVTQSGAVYGKKSDFNFDGRADFLWQNVDGRLAVWGMNGLATASSVVLRNGARVGAGWQIVATQDFNSDGKVDILWQHADGRFAIWFMDGVNFVRAELLSGLPKIASSWRFNGLGDFTGDAKDDFIFRHSDGYLLLWQMNGKTFVKQKMLLDGEPIPTSWKIVGVADFNGDNKPDILWQNTDSSLILWRMNGSAVTSGTLLSNLPKNVNASITGLNDLNQDGKTDLIWRHADSRLSVWFMNGTNRLSVADINGGTPVTSAWKLVAPKN